MSRVSLRSGVITLRLPNRDATLRLGTALGRALEPGDVLALVGDIGMGKTTLTQGVARGAGYSGSVTSPTYTLIHEYHGSTPIVHVDPYRLERPVEMLELGLAEYLEQPYALIVEWADRLADLLPEDRLTIRLDMKMPAEATEEEDDGDRPRHAELSASGIRSSKLLESAQRAIPDLVVRETGDDRVGG